MASILPLDELNRLDEEIRNRFGDEPLPKSKADEEDIIDELLDLFLLAYAVANDLTNLNLNGEWKPSVDEVMGVVDAEVAGETWRDRVHTWFASGGTGADISRIADTEMHRIANTAALETARRGGATKKTWATMLDDRVRETHDYLEGVTVGIDDEFITYDGDRAQFPGGFETAENNINCRCELLFS